MRFTLLVALALATPAVAQVSYSIDYNGPTISLPDSMTFTPITEGDILTPGTRLPVLGPLPQPGILIPGGPAGVGLWLHPGCIGHPPGTNCPVELDALSYGMDLAQDVQPAGSLWYSVDEFAVGLPGFPLPPTVVTEGGFGAWEAGADVFVVVQPLPSGPLPPFAVPAATTGALDGNGWWSASGFAYPGVGLIEWNPPGAPPDLGDTLDAMDVDGPIAAHGIFFSLDAGWADPMTGFPHSASALAHGFVGGDVLVTPAPGLVPVLYAPAPVLGLDRLFGPDSDDLDALAVFENGAPGYQPSLFPYDWLGGNTDMLLFSVRRGSAIIGAPDSFFGAPIEEGDILTTPPPGGPGTPGIFIAAENLGLATLRSGTPANFGDDLNALDFSLIPVMDCDGNGVEDAVEIFTGAALDCNFNGVPDSCDLAFGPSCDADGTLVPDECEYSALTSYCTAKVNSAGCTPIIGAYGTPSATCGFPFNIAAVDTVSNKNGLFFYGYVPLAAPWKGGFKCVKSPVRRTPIQNSGGVGTSTCTGVYTYDMNARIQSGWDPALTVGTTVYGQYWGRDPTSSFTVSLSDGFRFTIAP